MGIKNAVEVVRPTGRAIIEGQGIILLLSAARVLVGVGVGIRNS